MLRIGITGQSGFIGTHLWNTLGLYQDKFVRVEFEDAWFGQKKALEAFVRGCDTIIHLAAMNRHNDPQELYTTNIGLVKAIIEACEATGSIPHIIFASSTQEERDNLYGTSKKDCRLLFEKWAEKNRAPFTGLIIPNVFGPFGKPYYNSFIATFCHQLTHGEKPVIDNDSQVGLIYVGELVEVIIEVAEGKGAKGESGKTDNRIENIVVGHNYEVKVTGTLSILESFMDNYVKKGILPDLTDRFTRNLFYTFVTYIDHSSFFPFNLELKTDSRGSFVETIRLNSGGQVSFSTTKPGITRGNHFHTRKAERFAVIKGKARIELRRVGTDKVISFDLDGMQPSFVDMPIWHTHNITNVGDEELYTIFWISEHYDERDPDTFYEVV